MGNGGNVVKGYAPAKVGGRRVLASFFSDVNEFVCVLDDDNDVSGHPIVTVQLGKPNNYTVDQHVFGFLPAVTAAASLAVGC